MQAIADPQRAGRLNVANPRLKPARAKKELGSLRVHTVSVDLTVCVANSALLIDPMGRRQRPFILRPN